jgi:hypothetical protein
MSLAGIEVNTAANRRISRPTGWMIIISEAVCDKQVSLRRKPIRVCDCSFLRRRVIKRLSAAVLCAGIAGLLASRPVTSHTRDVAAALVLTPIIALTVCAAPGPGMATVAQSC